ncbi:hypothetical protein QQS21_004663 [Conoideocrella luteorostrata]|uniref:Cell wall glycoprotein n=1 Tax=Conoideocrella luteorostrata TaxID=1105319 RepID=A0AAJ0CTX6_9HYPO|nr:hypothetical protein QQS21_004663 [Conoideocrella luteorostrata]
MYAMKSVVLGSAVASASAIAGRTFGNATAPGVVYTTEVVTALTTFCPVGTHTVNSKTYTVTQATTLTITDCPCTVSKPVQPTSTPGQDECSKKCYDGYNACRSKPGANMSFCASEFVGCLGFNPYSNDGSLITPTACSKGPAPTGSPTPTGAPAPKDCAKGCYDEYNACRSKPGANMSFCASKFVGCLGYNPYSPDGSLVTPTACSKAAPTTLAPTNPAGTQPAGGKDCPAECSAAYNMCRGKPGANMSFCASKYADCLGYNPYGPDGSLITPTACSAGAKPTGGSALPTGTLPTGTGANPPAVTAGAGQMTPAMALLALGAVALL